MKRLKELFSKAIGKLKRDKVKEPYIRLRDMEIVSQDKIDYSYIVYNIIGYKDRVIDKILFRQDKKLKIAYKRAIKLIKPIRALKPNHMQLKEGMKTKIPLSIDFISFRAMMELTAVVNQGIVTNLQDLMAHTIAIATYSENHDGDYDSGLETFKEYRESLLDEPLDEMLSIYNWIDKSLQESQVMWERRFLSVDVEDEDYEAVNGAQKMAQFNVINTVKNLCHDFNIEYDKAWQMPYAISQTNSYAKATYSYIQDEMRQLKEQRMKMERRKNGG